MQHWIRPGVKLIDMCEHLEGIVRSLVEVDGLKAGTAVCYTSACDLCEGLDHVDYDVILSVKFSLSPTYD